MLLGRWLEHLSRHHPFLMVPMASQCDALGMGMRKKLLSWLADGHDSVPDDPLPTISISSQSGIGKVTQEVCQTLSPFTVQSAKFVTAEIL